MKITAGILLILLSYAANGQQVYFNNQYDFYKGLDGATSVLEIDSGYLVVGGFRDSTLGDRKLGILHLDINGNVISKISYGKFNADYWSGWSGSLTQTADGGFALGGSIDIGSTSRAMLWRFDKNMDTLWTKTYGSPAYDQIGYQCKQTLDGSFVMIGATNQSGNEDILLIKTDSLGNLLWNTTYGGGQDEPGFTIDVCYDGGYIIGGEKIDVPSDNIDNWVIKVDSVGNIEWDTTFGGPFEDLGTFVKQTQDSGYIVGGGYSLYEVPPDFYQSKPRVIKLDNLGNVEWDNLYGPARFAGHVLVIDELPDGAFIVAGQSNNNLGTPTGNGWAVSFTLQISAQGDSIWYREHEYDTCIKNDDYLRDMKPTSDGGFITAGFFSPRPVTPCNDTGNQDMWVLKLDSCGCAYAGCDSACQQLVGVEELQDEESKILIYPNPFSFQATVQFDKVTADAELTIYDVTGRLLRKYSIPKNQNSLTLVGEEIGTGIFFLQLSQEHSVIASQKVIINK
ncbi:MAG: T9SS type A sorting domain-containing protein [Flavobacteriales bacterium]|nr:T9SS type A sorting domain-containing protein [Flavobacteriales bacterium]